MKAQSRSSFSERTAILSASTRINDWVAHAPRVQSLAPPPKTSVGDALAGRQRRHAGARALPGSLAERVISLLLRSLVVLHLLACSEAFAGEPFIEKIDLFQAGQGGYAVYHIPGIVVTAKGSVLAWCEARKKGGDWDDIRILLRRSTDDGKAWSEPKSIADVPGPKAKNPFSLGVKGVNPDDVTYNNPVLIADRDGTVHCLFCLEYMRCFYMRSADDGVTWSVPVEITAAFEDFHKTYAWKVLATGPDHSIQLKSGRLIVPVWLSTGTGGNAHRPSVTATIFSDDQGRSWHAGEIAVPCTEE